MQTLRLALGIQLALVTAMEMNRAWAQPTQAQDIDLDYLCQRSLFNRCKGYQSPEQSKKQSFRKSQDNVPQVIKIKLNDLSGVSEWVRIEITGRSVKLLHTTVAPSTVAKAISTISGIPSAFTDSNAARAVSIIGALPPLAHTWYDHPTSRILFQLDSCEGAKETATCVLTGTNTIQLPAGTDLSKGNFTLEYTERKLLRTVTFRVPPQKL